MTKTQIGEIRPALIMTHRSRKECEQHPMTQLYIQWAERHGFAWSIAKRLYDNLPSATEMESYDHEPKESRHYWELHVQIDHEVPQFGHRAATGAADVDEALANEESLRQGMRDYHDGALAELSAAALAVTAEYDRRKVYPRQDRNYATKCLREAVWTVLSGSRAAQAYSGSQITTDEVVAALGITDFPYV